MSFTLTGFMPRTTNIFAKSVDSIGLLASFKKNLAVIVAMVFAIYFAPGIQPMELPESLVKRS